METPAINWPTATREPKHVARWRAEARERLASAGLPTAADEHWRRANFGFLRALSIGVMGADAPADVDALAGFTRVVFVDGRCTAVDDDEDAVAITRLHAALRARPRVAFPPNDVLEGDLRPALLARALGADGVHVVVRRDGAARRPILLDHRGASECEGVAAVSHAIRLEAGASATLVELYDERCGAERTLLSDVRVELGAGSRLLHVRIVAPGHASHLVDTLSVDAGRDAQYVQRSLLAPLRALRSTQHVRLGGAGAHAALHAGIVASRRADVDLRVLALHEGDATRSEQALHVLGGRGRATVDSEARVPVGRRAIRSRQSLRALQLDAACDVALRPRLAILSDDVDCRHGATTSALSDEQLFFLRSRGLPAADAHRMLAAAHLQQLFPSAGDAALDALLQRALHDALAAAIPPSSEDTR